MSIVKRPKVLCAIGHGLYEPWVDIITQGQEKTWLAIQIPENFQIIHFHGTPVGSALKYFDRVHERLRWTNRPIGMALKIFDTLLTWPFLELIPTAQVSKLISLTAPVLHVRQPDIYLTHRWKLLGMFRHILNTYDFDYLFTTTSSSYLRPNLLIDLLETAPRVAFYAGAVAYEGANFAAGNNRILSRDLVELFIEKPRIFSAAIIEDVSMAQGLFKAGMSLIPMPQMNISSLETLKNTPDDDLKGNFHFRLKSGSYENRGDVEIMRELHRRFLVMGDPQ